MDGDRHFPKPGLTLTPEEEEFLRIRYPRASYWVLGTELPEAERSSLLLRGRGGSSRRAGLRPNAVRAPSPPSTRTSVHNVPNSSRVQAGIGSFAGSRSPALLANQLNLIEGPPSVSSDPYPDDYFGPCWECLAESTFHITHGGDSIASSILGSCRHR